jgi:hypothetical protein
MKARIAVVVIAALVMSVLVWYAVMHFPYAGATIDLRPSTDSAIPLPPLGPRYCGGSCGTERWAVKTLSDDDRDQVDLRPVDVTIEKLVRQRRPEVLLPFGRAELEKHVFRVEGQLIRLIQENDQDWHLVIASVTNPSVTMVAEVPNPDCSGVCTSGFGEIYSRVRTRLLDRTNASGGARSFHIRLTGVAFFDYAHGQIGLAPNGIELHPILAVEFLDQ